MLHSSTQMAPADVTPDKALVIWRRLYKPTAPLKPYQFRPGDFVRTSKRVKRGNFIPPSYRGTFSADVYTVTASNWSLYDGVNYYKLETWQGQKVPGRFYKLQLQKGQSLPNHWRVNKKLKYRGRGPPRQILMN